MQMITGFYCWFVFLRLFHIWKTSSMVCRTQHAQTLLLSTALLRDIHFSRKMFCLVCFVLLTARLFWRSRRWITYALHSARQSNHHMDITSMCCLLLPFVCSPEPSLCFVEPIFFVWLSHWISHWASNATKKKNNLLPFDVKKANEIFNCLTFFWAAQRHTYLLFS